MTILDDEENTPSKDETAEYEAALLKLEERCKAANIELTKQQEPQQSLFESGGTYLTLQLPCGRGKRSVSLWSLASIQRLLAIDFEKYVFLSDYEAICSYHDGTIECLVRTLDRMPTNFLWRRIYGDRRPMADPPENEFTIVVQSEEHQDLSITICQASKELQVLHRGQRVRVGLAFRVVGVAISRHDEAVSLLTKLANALFFQMEMSYGISLTLERERTPMSRRRSKPLEQKPEDLQFPKREYDDAPISLYWYGCSAVGMPLLQFLAFYQVLEYYFPPYSQAEAKRRIGNILKNPLFRPDRDSDIGQLLNAIVTRGGGVGDERSQLRATLYECIDTEQLRAFLTNDEAMMEFFQKKKSLSTHKLPLGSPSIDLRNDVADRIYDIRCKIVHTKGDGIVSGPELLLPFSKEASELYYDIDLLRFLSRQVLIAASSPLRLS